MSRKSKFRSHLPTRRKLVLSFERVGDSYWTTAGELAAMADEMERLDLNPDHAVQLKYRRDEDGITHPAGWSLELFGPEESSLPDTAFRGESS